jgi:hypothetical protein
MTIDFSQAVQIEDPETIAHDLVIASRRAAYMRETDPMRFEIEYDAIAAGIDLDLTDWVQAVKAIKLRYPLPA